MDDPEVQPEMLYTSAQVRELDRVAIEDFGIPGGVLMQRAGRAALHALLQRWPEPAALQIFCGTGNNGGDGSVMAALARARGIPVTLWQVGDAGRLSGVARAARDSALSDGVEVRSFSGTLPGEGVVVDALLGTGLSDAVREPFLAAIRAINSSGLPVMAVDVPSGLCGDTGRVLGEAVRADLSISFIGRKLGLHTGQGPDYAGATLFDALDVPAEVYARVPAAARMLQGEALCATLLPPRRRCAHKGDFGHVLVVGGDLGMGGAPAMAAQAAARVGAGLVSCATRAEHLPGIVARCPEVMARPVSDGRGLDALLARASVVVVGPGLGQGAWGEQLWQRVSATNLPLVVDADALNLLANGVGGVSSPRDSWVLTPHPGEAARLLGCSTAEVQSDRLAAVHALQGRYGGAVVLKGAGTLVSAGAGAGLCTAGNPGMGSGGMGDVLSGVLGGLLAQGLAPAAAAELGVCLHALAGDRAAAADGERGLLATDLIPQLRSLVNGR